MASEDEDSVTGDSSTLPNEATTTAFPKIWIYVGVGIFVGLVAFVVIVILVVCLVRKRRRRRENAEQKNPPVPSEKDKEKSGSAAPSPKRTEPEEPEDDKGHHPEHYFSRTGGGDAPAAPVEAPKKKMYQRLMPAKIAAKSKATTSYSLA